MAARLKLKGIDGRAHKEWSLRLNSTQRGEPHWHIRGCRRAARRVSWMDLRGGAWPFLVRGATRLVNSDNEQGPDFQLECCLHRAPAPPGGREAPLIGGGESGRRASGLLFVRSFLTRPASLKNCTPPLLAAGSAVSRGCWGKPKGMPGRLLPLRRGDFLFPAASGWRASISLPLVYFFSLQGIGSRLITGQGCPSMCPGCTRATMEGRQGCSGRKACAGTL